MLEGYIKNKFLVKLISFEIFFNFFLLKCFFCVIVNRCSIGYYIRKIKNVFKFILISFYLFSLMFEVFIIFLKK